MAKLKASCDKHGVADPVNPDSMLHSDDSAQINMMSQCFKMGKGGEA